MTVGYSVEDDAKRVIYNRFVLIVASNNDLSEHEYGFPGIHSRVNAIGNFRNSDSGDCCAVLALDVKNANWNRIKGASVT